MTSQNGVFYFFIFVHLFGSDERGPLTNIKGKDYQNILFQSKDTTGTI